MQLPTSALSSLLPSLEIPPGATSAALFDVGTNSVKVLVVRREQAGWRPLREEVAITRLGEGLPARGKLRRAAVERTLQALCRMRRQAVRLGASVFVGVATSAARRATDQKGFLRQVLERTGIQLEVINTQREARLAYLGATSFLGRRGHWTVVDIGGGSLQLSAGIGMLPERIASVPWGSVRVTEKFLPGDPPKEAAFERAREALRPELERACASFRRRGALAPPFTQPQRAGLVGIGGTVATIAALDAGLECLEPERVSGYLLQPSRVAWWRKRLGAMRLEERRRFGAIPRGREDILPAGMLLLELVLKALAARSLRFSVRGIRWGLLRWFDWASGWESGGSRVFSLDSQEPRLL